MIVFDLQCGRRGHVFEAWFGSTDDYQEQRERGLVECPLCGDPEVAKAVMAPRVGAKANRAAASGEAAPLTTDIDSAKRLMAAMAIAQREMPRALRTCRRAVRR
jgi:hypothetical protein